MLLMLVANLVHGAAGAIKWTQIETNGWQLLVCVDTFATNQAFSFGWGQNNTIVGIPKVIVTMSSAGYDTTGTPVTRFRTLYGTRQLRYPYPNQNFDYTYASGADVILRIALNDYVYASDTSVQCSIAANWYGANLAVSAQSVTNASAQGFFKTIAKNHDVYWDRITGNSYTRRVMAFNRHAQQGSPVAAVKFWAKDASGHSATTIVTRLNRKLEYEASINASTFTQGDQVTNYFIAYPWIGDATSIVDSSDGAHPIQTPYYHETLWLADQTNLYGTAVAVVATNGVSGGVVITNGFNPASPPTAFDSISRAAAALAQTNNAVYGHNDCGGGIIYLRAGNHSFIGTGGAPPTTRGKTWLTISGFPTDVKYDCRIANGTGNGDIEDFIKFDGVTFTSTDAFTISACSNAWFNACIFDTTGSDLVDGTGLHFATSCVISNFGQGFTQPGSQNQCWALVKDCEIHGLFPRVHPYTVTGMWKDATNLTASFISSAQTGIPFPAQDCIFANDRFYNLNYSGSTFFSFYNTFACSNGMAAVQCLFENVVSGLPGQMFSIHSDGALTETTNVMVWNCTGNGERIAYGYNDQGTSAINLAGWCMKNNAWGRAASKSDTFVGGTGQNGNRIGNWPIMYYVGSSGNINICSTNDLENTGQFLHTFAGLNSFELPLTGYSPETGSPVNPVGWYRFVRDGSSYRFSNTGTGNGDYHLLSNSPGVIFHCENLISYDLEQNERGDFDPPGPYVSASPRKGTE